MPVIRRQVAHDRRAEEGDWSTLAPHSSHKDSADVENFWNGKAVKQVEGHC